MPANSTMKVKTPTRNTLCKRIIPCLDIAEGRIVKGVNFKGLVDAGDPVRQSLLYEQQGADEIMFLDITASVEGRKTTIDLVKEVARRLSIPLTVGGGISKVEDVARLLDAGADKVSMNTAAVLNPELVNEVANSFGSQCCVVAIDAKLDTGQTTNGVAPTRASLDTRLINEDSDNKPGWTVLIRGGREGTGLDAWDWAKQCIARGAGEILLTSWDYDGTKQGFDIPLTRAFSELPVPVIASGGASGAESFAEVFSDGQADAALAASIFHFSECTVREIKEYLCAQGVQVRL